MAESNKAQNTYEDEQYVETDLRTTASAKLQEEINKELEVEDPPIEEARARLKKD